MRVRFRRPTVVGLLALAASLVCLVVLSQAKPGDTGVSKAVGTGSLRVSAVSSTTVRRVSPLDSAGHLRSRFGVRSTRRGYCWTASFMNGRLYRCFQGNLIRDPCWKEAGRRSVVCLGTPWSTGVARLRLTKRLPAREDHRPGIWGLRLGGVGVNCLVSTGAGGTVGTHPISYFCRRGWVLVGNGPNRSQPLWTMLTAKAVGPRYELRGRKPLPVAWKAVVR